MTLYLALAAASFVFVFLKAFQQRNVAFDHFAAVIPTSIGMAAMEVFVVAKVAATGWSMGVVLAVGLASGSGAMLAMAAHRKFFNNPPTE